MLSAAFLELVNLALIGPFINVVLFDDNSLGFIGNFSYLANSSFIKEDLKSTITYLFSFVLIFATSIRLLNLRLSNKFTALYGAIISSACFDHYISLSPDRREDVNSNVVISVLTTQVNNSITSISLFLNFFSAFAITCLISLGIIYINPFVALTVYIVFGLLYLFIVLINKKYIQKNSSTILINIENQVKLIQKVLGLSDEIYISKTHSFYNKMYFNLVKQIKLTQAKNIFLQSFTRFVFEPLGIALIFLISFYLRSVGNSQQSVLAIVATLALATQRALPNLQQMYRSWSGIVGYKSDIEKIYNIMQKAVYPVRSSAECTNNSKFLRLTAKNLFFDYSKGVNVLSNLNFELYRGDVCLIKGKTGSGKSTLLKLMMSLKRPSNGELILETESNTYENSANRFTDWSQHIAYVPQNPFFFNDTVKRNVVLNHEIDLVRLEECLKLCCVWHEITSLEQGVDTLLGENGCLLSGGQLQRLAIARALYTQKDILALDESTSALDPETQEKLMENLISCSDKTFLMIAHRKDLFKYANKVISLYDLPKKND